MNTFRISSERGTTNQTSVPSYHTSPELASRMLPGFGSIIVLPSRISVTAATTAAGPCSVVLFPWHIVGDGADPD